MIHAYRVDDVEIKVTWSIQYFGDRNGNTVPFVSSYKRRNELREKRKDNNNNEQPKTGVGLLLK
jgi:hypothetical protein